MLQSIRLDEKQRYAQILSNFSPVCFGVGYTPKQPTPRAAASQVS